MGEARQRVHLVHELRERLVPKNSLMAATTGRMLINVWGVMASTSWVVMRSRTTRSMRDRPMRTWFWISSPTERMAVGEVVLVVEAVAGLGVDQVQQVGGGEDLAARQHRLARLGPVEVDHREGLAEAVELGAELAVELVAADPAEVVAAGSKKALRK